MRELCCKHAVSGLFFPQSADKLQGPGHVPAVWFSRRGSCAQPLRRLEVVFWNADPGDCSPERYTDLVFCPVELNDAPLHSAVQQYLAPLSVGHSVLADWSLMCFFFLFFSYCERVRQLETSLKLFVFCTQASFRFMRLHALSICTLCSCVVCLLAMLIVLLTFI